ncbi:MAG: hypothetical protein [Caudoviricetes sp.]|nr:MAG: hypothetical protein [Caudoviricetes sp.]
MITLDHFIKEAELKNIEFSSIDKKGKNRTVFYKNNKQYIVSSIDNVVIFVLETGQDQNLISAVLEEYAENYNYPEAYENISLLEMFKKFCQ